MQPCGSLIAIMLKVSTIVTWLVVFVLQNHNARSDGPAVALDSSAAQITPHTDESVRTNQDTPLYDDKVDALYPIPLRDQNFPEFMVIPEGTRHGGLVRESRQAQAVTSLGKDYLLFCNRQFLVMINRNGTGVKAFQTGTTNIIACDFDIRDSYMFWSDVNSKHIARAKLDGTGLTILVQTGITVPDGIAWDWVNHRLYWTDAEDRDIEVLDPATGSREVLITTGNAVQSKPRAIVLDPIVSRKMYWTDWGTLPRIERASLNGTSREILHSSNLFWPNALTIDLPTQTLYWADAGLDRIECSRADGSGRRVLIAQFILHPFGIDFFNGVLYWTDWQYKAVLNSTIHHDTTQPTFTIYSVIANLIHHPMGIKVVSLSKQPTGVMTPSPICTPECQNGGTCSSPGVCTCATGWRGNRCQNAVCNPLCSNGGTCVAPGTCSCAAGWEGNTCSIAVCAGGCENNGSCILPGVCSCPRGWIGSRCTEPVCAKVCEHGSCTAPDTCTCRTGWTGQWCDKPVCNPSCNHGDCVRPDECVCHTGWKGRLCTKPICSRGCHNGGDCVQPDTCECFSPYYGPTCDEVECFPPSGCKNGGHCVSPSLCACPIGWTGIRCEIAMCGSMRCVHGRCGTKNKCICNSGWSGDTCEEAICFPPDGCQNGGHCVAPGFCSCASGWTGERCNEGICQKGCQNGNCIGPDECVCHEGWSGSTCSDAICNPNCVNGNCVRPNLCVCDNGYYGYRCEY